MRDDGWKSEFEVKTGSRDMAVAIRIDQIDVGYRLRQLDMDKVAALKASIEEMGLRTPISVSGSDSISFKDPDFRVRLSAGAHRLEAMRQLGREYVAAIVRDEDDLDSELWEIDENLCRAELTPADRALFVFRRKEIYQLKYPETANGANQHTRLRQVGEASEEPKRFTAATAEATGQSERAVQRDAERGEKISEKALRMLRGTRHDKGTVLDRLKSLREEEQEVYVKALFDADKASEKQANEIRTDKMATKRAIKTGIINAIAAHGKVVAGEMPRAAFAVGYADPPWEQEAWSDETGQDKGLMYPPMPLDEIKALCAGDKSPFTPDAVLFLWVSTNRLDDGIAVMKAWGFEFVTAITWDKVNIGMGRWVRDRTEHLLIGKRGDFPGLEMGTQPESLYSEVKTTHSRKPVWFAEQIDRLFPDMRKLELFQRKASLAEGDIRLNGMWDFWGFEATAPGGQIAECDLSEEGLSACSREGGTSSRLPPGPGENAPVEFSVGGLKKNLYAKFSVRLDDGAYLVNRTHWLGCTGGSGSVGGNFATFGDALRAAISELRDVFHRVIDDTSSTCAKSHKAAARAGLKWLDARALEWGLITVIDAPVRADHVAETADSVDETGDMDGDFADSVDDDADIDEPPVKAKGKAKKAAMSEWEADRQKARAEKRAYRDTLAGMDDEDLINTASMDLDSYDWAVKEGDYDGMLLSGARVEAIADHLYGVDPDATPGASPFEGNGRFDCLHDAQVWLLEQLRAKDGDVPMFGQPGRFLVEVGGCRVDFHYAGLFSYTGGSAYVVDLDKPFISETGFRSFQVLPFDRIVVAKGIDLAAYVRRVMESDLTGGGKKKLKLHAPPFGLQIDGVRKSDEILEGRKSDPAYQPGGYLFDLVDRAADAEGEAA